MISSIYALLLTSLSSTSVVEDENKAMPRAMACPETPPKSAGGSIIIGETWSGVNTGIGGATDANGNLIAAYFDADRFVSLVSMNSLTQRLCRTRINSQFGGWDAHNSLTLAISNDGIVHVAGNMHASPLVYARGEASNIDSVKMMPMTGMDEQHATYPRFLFDDARNLLFMYRDGASGAGRWLVNKWNEGSWVRMGELFASQDDKGHVSAYPGDFVRDFSGRYHVAVVWRRTKDVSSNFAVTYASTLDFQTWDIGHGRTAKSPLTPTTMEVIATPGERAGLVNNVRLTLSSSGRPVTLYTRYDESGLNAIFAAIRNSSGWITKAIATAKVRKEIVGGGSLAGLPIGVFGEVQSKGIVVNIALGSGDTRHLLLTPETLDTSPYKAAPDDQAKEAITYLRTQARGMADVGTPATIVRLNGVDGPISGYLRWFAQKANSDLPRACTKDAPAACDPPPAPLLWFPLSDGV